MLIKYRPARLDDLPQCLECIRDGFAYTSEERMRLLALWRRLLLTGAGNLAVIEDATAPAHQRIVWFCCAAFVAPEYARDLRETLPPFLAKQALMRWEAGRCPLMTRSQVAIANSNGGLHVIVLNSGPAPHIMRSMDLWNQLAAKVVDFGAYHLQGYRMSEFLIEVYTPFTYEWCESGGLDCATDYAGRMSLNDEIYAAGNAPRLYVLTAARARHKRGAVMGALFQYSAPCFFFSAAQQEFLLHALTGETDEEIARNIGIAPATARKRWNTVYERIADCAPDALGVQGLLPQKEGRGGERKRLLISYLRHHMEELRPLMPILAPWPPETDDAIRADHLGIDALFALRSPATRN